MSRLVLMHYTAPSYAGGVETALNDFAHMATRAGRELVFIVGRSTALDHASFECHEIDLLNADHPTIRQVNMSSAESPSFQKVEDQIFSRIATILRPDDLIHAHNITCKTFNLPLVRAMRRLLCTQPVRMAAWSWDPVWDQEKSLLPLRPDIHDLLCTPWPNTVYITPSATRAKAFERLGTFPPQVILEWGPYIDESRLFSMTDRSRTICDHYDLLRREIIITYPCRMARRKNIEFALRTTLELVRAAVKPILLLGGFASPHRSSDSLQYRAEMETFIEENSLASNVVWLDQWRIGGEATTGLSSADVVSLHRIADVLFSPSHDEGFGLGVLEAAANSLPIVASHQSILVFADHPMVHPMDVDLCTPAEAADLLLRSSENRRRARGILARYSGRRYLGQLDDLLERRFARLSDNESADGQMIDSLKQEDASSGW